MSCKNEFYSNSRNGRSPSDVTEVTSANAVSTCRQTRSCLRFRIRALRDSGLGGSPERGPTRSPRSFAESCASPSFACATTPPLIFQCMLNVIPCKSNLFRFAFQCRKKKLKENFHRGFAAWFSVRSFSLAPGFPSSKRIRKCFASGNSNRKV